MTARIPATGQPRAAMARLAGADMAIGPARRAASRGIGARLRSTISLTAVAAMVFLLAVGLTAAFADLVAPHDPLEQRLGSKLQPPFWEAGADPRYILGTDPLGRDVLSRMIYGGRVSLVIGLGAVAIQALIGATAGLIAGYYRGWPDALLMRIADIQLAIPSIILAIVIMALIGASVGSLILVLGLTNWVVYGRTVRSEALVARTTDYVGAAIALGATDVRVIVRHVLPSVQTSMIVVGSLELAKVIILEASLSFLGLGIQPPTPTWGVMIGEARGYLAVVWWLPTLPGVLIFLTSLSCNLVGDWFRDLADPTHRPAG